jgi:nicotinamidase-related amidase
MLSLATVHPIDLVVKHSRALADAFRRHGLPVVFVTVTGAPPGRTDQARNCAERSSDWTDLLPELERQPGEHGVVKRTWSAFRSTGLVEHL